MLKQNRTVRNWLPDRFTNSSNLPFMWQSGNMINCVILCPPESFWTNPQYRVQIEELFDECSSKQNDKNILVSLMQKPDKRNRRLVQNLHIGFSIFEVNITCRFVHMNKRSWKELILDHLVSNVFNSWKALCLNSFKMQENICKKCLIDIWECIF